MTIEDLLKIRFKICGNNPDEGLDCLTFILYYYEKMLNKKLDIEIPVYGKDWEYKPEERDFYSANIKKYCKLKLFTSIEYLNKNDILFFYHNDSVRISHAGVYLGEGKFIHCLENSGVVITELKGYYLHKLVCVGEINE